MMENNKIYFDEKLVTLSEFFPGEILASDALSFGFGLFETIKIIKGKPVFFGEHFERIRRSAFFLDLPFDSDVKGLYEKTIDLSSVNKIDNGSAKIRLLKGTAGSHILISVDKREYPRESYHSGVRLIISERRKNERSILVYHKTLNYLENILERKKAVENGYFDGLLLNSREEIAETSSANIFFLKDERIFTPAVECGILPGVTRERIISIARKEGVDLSETRLSGAFIAEADGAFLTNALLGVMPIKAIDEREYEINNEIIALLTGKYRQAENNGIQTGE